MSLIQFKASRRLKLLFGLALLSLPCAAVAYGANTPLDPASALDLLWASTSILDSQFSKIYMLQLLSLFVALLALISFFKAATFAKVGSSQRLADSALGFLQIGLALSVLYLVQIGLGELQVSSQTSAAKAEPVSLQGATCGTIAPQGAEIIRATSGSSLTTKEQLLQQATWSEVR